MIIPEIDSLRVKSPRLSALRTCWSVLAVTLIALSGTGHAGEADHGLSDQLAAEAQALAPAFKILAPAATTATATAAPASSALPPAVSARAA